LLLYAGAIKYAHKISFGFIDRADPAGPFAASAGVFTNVTRESVAEFVKELRGVRGDIPITAKELQFWKQAIIRGFPCGFEMPGQMANRLSDVVLYDLPDDYFNSYIQKVRAVTLDDVQRVANRYWTRRKWPSWWWVIAKSSNPDYARWMLSAPQLLSWTRKESRLPCAAEARV